MTTKTKKAPSCSISFLGTDNEWCHLCGKRSNKHAFIYWAENAEASGKKGECAERLDTYSGRAVRICEHCAAKIADVAANKIKAA